MHYLIVINKLEIYLKIHKYIMHIFKIHFMTFIRHSFVTLYIHTYINLILIFFLTRWTSYHIFCLNLSFFFFKFCFTIMHANIIIQFDVDVSTFRQFIFIYKDLKIVSFSRKRSIIYLLLKASSEPWLI